MRAFRLLALSAPLLQPVAALAAGPCPPMPTDPVAVEVVYDIPAPSYRYDLNKQALTDMARSRGSAHGMDQIALGLTQSAPYWAFETEVTTRAYHGSKTACIQPTRIIATLGFRALSVFVASEYPPGSCPFEAVREHEEAHVAIHRQALDAYAKRAQDVLGREAARIRPIATENPENAQQAILARLNAAMNKVFTDYNAYSRRENAKIDTRESYARTKALCADW